MKSKSNGALTIFLCLSIGILFFGCPRNYVRATSRALLATGQNEEIGYGLYSYLLLGAKPTEGTRDRYLAAIKSYVEMIETTENLKKSFTRNQLNVTYLPVTKRPNDDVKPSAEWLLDHYDFVRATKVLAAFEQADGIGPYIISTLEPVSLNGGNSVFCPCLFQDLSTVHPSIMVLWIQEFKKQASQEEFWKQNTRDAAILRLRNAIAVAASALDATKKSAEEWTSILTSLISWAGAKTRRTTALEVSRVQRRSFHNCQKDFTVSGACPA